MVIYINNLLMFLFRKKEKKKASDVAPDIDGYIQVFFERSFDTDDDGDRDNTTFTVDRARFELDGKISDKLGYSLGLNATADGPTDIMRDAYIWSKHIPLHELRVGQQKTQFGYENVESSTKLYYANRSEVADVLARGPTRRDIGIGFIGDIPLGRGFSIEDSFTAVNGAGHNVTTDNTPRKSYWGRLGGRYEDKDPAVDVDARIGVSFGVGDILDPGADPESTIDDFHYDFRRVGLDAQVDHTYGFVAAEYVWGRNTDLVTDVEYDASGYYVLVAGKTPWKVGPILRYDTYDDETPGAYKRWTFGAYYGTRAAKLRLMVNYEHRSDRDDRLILWSQAKL